MKKLWLIALLSCALTARADVQIATVDIDGALKDSVQISEMQKALESKFKPQQKAIEEKRIALKKAMDDVRRNESVMKPADLKKKKADVEGQMKALQLMQSKFQQDLYASRREKMMALHAAFEKAVSQVAEKQHIDLVVNQAAKVYSHNISDITDDVKMALKKNA